MKLTTEQLAKLLFKTAVEPRRNAKRFLKDLGGDGTSEELDRMLEQAKKNKAAIKASIVLADERKAKAGAIEAGVDGRVAEMLADIRLRMEEAGLSQSDLATACGWQQPLVSQYLSGTKEPGIKNLAKLASAVGCVWRLQTTR